MFDPTMMGGMDPRAGGMLGSMMAQGAPRNMLGGNPGMMQFGKPMQAGGQGTGAPGGQMPMHPDGSFNTTPFEMLVERLRSQNKLQKLKQKELQAAQQMLSMPNMPGGAGS